MTTPARDPDETARVDSDARFTPRYAGGEVQFAPGTIIAGRYRVSSILGSGGMGEVYRADDTKLGQTVALKFLPARFAHDQILLGRLHDEVRLGRQIAHPNVCRIYDIVEDGNAHFVTMEYVDGEDLSRLLRRIGRLAHDKAVDIARGIAAGLMAAHAKGILHRDLKPANVMIDSGGDARIMDFGLALAAGEEDGTISGTPAYMAPEQLDGQPATVQSDLYALGLVMYELFTGKRVHSARTLVERIRDATSEITTPSSLIQDLDPAVERIILRCLSHDPAQRPRSAREVIHSLPGGDPLAAALAAGETPSPRIVAAAGSEGSLKPWQAWSLLGAALLFLGIAVAGWFHYGANQVLSFDTSAEVQTERARSIARRLGIPEQPFRVRSYRGNTSYVGWIMQEDRSQTRWERLRRGPAAITFLLVESAEPLPPGSRDDEDLRPGMTAIDIDLDGQLAALTAAPRTSWTPRPLDWKPLFAAAGLDPDRLTPAQPRLVPRSTNDVHAAWSGAHPEDGTPIHVEAAAWRGTPVFFAISGPWESTSIEHIPFAGTSTTVFVTLLVATVIVIGLLLAWRNMRLHRGDRQSALRVASVMFALELTARLLRADHVAALGHELSVVQRAAADALLWAAVLYVLYLALEPFVRRRWPEQLIASSRLLSGNYRDPMVGRDVLIGLLVGIGHPALIMAESYFARIMGMPPLPPFGGRLEALFGPRYGLAHLADALGDGALQGFVMIVVLVVFMIVMRRRLPAAVGLGAVILTGYIIARGAVMPGSVVLAIVFAYVAARYGLLALAVAQVAFHSIFYYPLFANASWTSLQLLPVAFVLAGMIWAFRTSLGGQPTFSGALLDE